MVAFLTSDLQWTYRAGGPIPSGRLHALLPAGVEDGATQYAPLELVNRHASSSWSSGRLWTAQDPRGGAFAVALVSTVAFTGNEAWPDTDLATLTYSAPTTKAAGLTLPTLAPGSRALLAVRRVLTGATPAFPESNRLLVDGSAPL